MKNTFIIFMLLLPLVSLPAQEEEQKDISVEQLYLQDNIKTMIIRSQANSNDRDLKMLAIKDIEAMLEEGSSADNKEIVKILGDLSSEGVGRIIRENGYIINDFPEVRREASRLLGAVGTEEAARALNLVLIGDREPMVLSEAMWAIANMETKNKKARNIAMSTAIYRQTNINKDNNFAFTYLQAIELIVEREKDSMDPMIFEEIFKIADASQGYNRRVREKALEVLHNMQQF